MVLLLKGITDSPLDVGEVSLPSSIVLGRIGAGSGGFKKTPRHSPQRAILALERDERLSPSMCPLRSSNHSIIVNVLLFTSDDGRLKCARRLLLSVGVDTPLAQGSVR